MSTKSTGIRIAIAGAGARMGQALTRMAGADFHIVGGTERKGAAQLGMDICMLANGDAEAAVAATDPAEAAKDADVWIDFTTPAATLKTLERLKGTGIKAAIVGA